jgi:hypothetical protein
MMTHILIFPFTLYSILLFSFCRQESSNSRINIQKDYLNEIDSGNLTDSNSQQLFKRFQCPNGYHRINVSETSFQKWLRNFPLQKDDAPVYLFNKNLKLRQDVHAAVLDIDVGKTDLQQCADAIMRLRAEYLFQNELFDSVVFTFTNGSKAYYSKWRGGFRPHIVNNSVSWSKDAPVDTSYKCFRQYMDAIFMYCGTYSLSKELKSVSIHQIQGGDVLIHGGFPGHAMIVMDIAINSTTGKRIFLLAQSYMPAQNIHIVKNFTNEKLSPWFEVPEDGIIETPEWTFNTNELKRFQ